MLVFWRQTLLGNSVSGFLLSLNIICFALSSVSNAAMEDLLTAATTGILRHVAAEEVAKERERREEEKRQAEEER